VKPIEAQVLDQGWGRMWARLRDPDPAPALETVSETLWNQVTVFERVGDQVWQQVKNQLEARLNKK
jgi:hypothetical protein